MLTLLLLITWQESVARLEQQPGHSLQVHHEAAYLLLASIAAAHQFHNTAVGTQCDSSIGQKYVIIL
jgi:hypothetical protein